MSDRVVSYLRTFVPIWWGVIVTGALARVGWLGGVLTTLGLDPTAPVVVSAVTSLAIGLWYAAWRWLEPRLPDWLTRVVLGSAKAPTYAPPAPVGE